MRFLLTIFILYPFFIFAQNKEDTLSNRIDCGTFQSIAEVMPEFPLGTDELISIINQTVKGLDCLFLGAKRLRFVVDTEGNMVNPEFDPKGNLLCKTEIADKLLEYPKWKPATQRGKPVCLTMMFPIKK